MPTANKPHKKKKKKCCQEVVLTRREREPQLGTEVSSTAIGGSDVAEASESEMENEEAGETNRGWEKVSSRKEKRRRRAHCGNSSNGKSLESDEENTRVNVRQQEEIKVKLQLDSPCSEPIEAVKSVT